MKLKAAVSISVILHISIFALAVFMPQSKSRHESIMVVDLLSIPGGGTGGGGGGGGGKIQQPEPPKKTQPPAKESGKSQQTKPTPTPTPPQPKMKDLTVKKEEPKSQLRYADKNIKKTPPKKEEKKELVTVVKNNDMKPITKTPSTTSTTSTNSSNSTNSSTTQSTLPYNVLKTGISSGSGNGTGKGNGSGTGSGGGSGSGSGGRGGSGFGMGGFPYSYYIEALRNRISSSWYSSLVSPGTKGRLVAGVYFKILRNGRIESLTLEEKSGNDSLDLSALRAIENAAPFPPLPPDYPETALVVHFEFEWEKK